MCHTRDLVSDIGGLAGGIGGFLLAGPWGAAAGAGIGDKLAGGSNSQALAAAAIGGAAGIGAGFIGTGTQAAAPITEASMNPASVSGEGGGVASATTPGTGGATAGGAAGGTSATATAAQPWYKNFSNLLAIGSGINGIMTAQQIKKMAAQAAAQQDPFASQRAGYSAQLTALDADPSKVTQLPGYKFAQQQGEQAILRQSAATGFNGSGNQAIALQQYDQALAGQYLSSEQARLASLAGAGFSPTGGNTMLQGNEYASSIESQALASIGYGFGGKQPGTTINIGGARA